MTIGALLMVLTAATAGGEDQPTTTTAGPPAANIPDLRPFAGDWERIADDEADALRLASIDSAIADLSWLVRKMAGGVLRESAAPPPEVRFLWTGEQLVQAVAVDGRTLERPVALRPDEMAVSAAGAAPVARTADVPVSWRWHDGRLEARWRHAQARGRTRFLHDPADDLLHVEYEIQVTALDGVAPIRYASRFERRLAAPQRGGAAAPPVLVVAETTSPTAGSVSTNVSGVVATEPIASR
jgi:hypothetical protein